MQSRTLPPVNLGIEPGQVRIILETPYEKSKEAVQLAVQALRYGFFRLDDRDDVKVDEPNNLGLVRATIMARHEQLMPPVEEENT